METRKKCRLQERGSMGIPPILIKDQANGLSRDCSKVLAMRPDQADIRPRSYDFKNVYIFC